MRHAILALLTLGPQYGLQIRTELAVRSGLSNAPNSGQIYQTLNRLLRDGLILVDGFTAKDQTLYKLTQLGEHEVNSWAKSLTTSLKPKNAYEEMVFHVLIIMSLPAFDEQTLINKYLEYWRRLKDSAGDTLRGRAISLQADAATSWLEELTAIADYEKKFLGARPTLGRPKKLN